MIGAVSGLGSYAVWPTYMAPARSSAAAENPSVVTAAYRPSNLEVPVQPVDSATPVTSEASGNLNIALSVQNSVDVTEMAVRMRISPAESDDSTVSPVGKEVESRQTGSLQLDYTSSLLQNYQMTAFLQAQISARMGGEDNSAYSVVLDALSKNGQDQMYFVSRGGETSNRFSVSLLGIVA